MASPQSFANNAITTLTAAITTSPPPGTIENWPVASAVLFPSVNNYTIKIDAELLLITAGAGTTTWSMSRGAENTLPAPHTIGAEVKQEWTKLGLDSLKDGYWPYLQPGGVAGALNPARFVGGSVGAPGSGTFVVGDFTVDPNGVIWVCTTAGSPGTFIGVGLNQTPAGAVSAYAGSTAPSGWLLCDGSAVAVSTHAALFAAIGYTYGGAGLTFNVPDLRGRVAVGVGAVGTNAQPTITVNQQGGEQLHTLVASENGQHGHNGVTGGETGHGHVAPAPLANYAGQLSSSTVGLQVGGSNRIGYGASTVNTGGSTGHLHGVLTDPSAATAGHNTMMPFVGLTMIIKT